ncbi:MAG: hypothetical protein ACXWFC_11840 [Nitrososphaeraceae archaeon]
MTFLILNIYIFSALEVANNSTSILSPTEAKNILIQLCEAAKKTALGGTDVLSISVVKSERSKVETNAKFIM